MVALTANRAGGTGRGRVMPDDIARRAGVGRESLYKSLSETGNPSFQTIARILDVLGVKMTFAAADGRGTDGAVAAKTASDAAAAG